MWHRHAGLLEFHCVVSTFIWSHLLPLNLFKRLNVSGNETGLSGQITTSKEYHSSPTIEQKKDVYRALFAQFYRLSGIFAHPVGTGSTSNNSRSWIPFLMGSLHIQSEQGPTSNNFRSWTQVLLASLATNSQLFVDTLVTTFQIPNARHACDAPRVAVHTRHMLVASTVSGLDAAGAHSQWHPRH